MYKIAIIESQPIIREGLCSLLVKQLGFNVIRAFVDYAALLKESDGLRPDVIFFDLNLCQNNEIEAIEKIKRQLVASKILIFSTNRHVECVRCALRAGVHGYVDKETTPAQLKEAVTTVMQGRHYLSATILPVVISSFIESEADRFPNTQLVNATILTIRERELLKLISNGYKNKEIANSLCLSVKTVEAHRSNLMKKLDVHNVVGLTTKANQLGIFA